MNNILDDTEVKKYVKIVSIKQKITDNYGSLRECYLGVKVFKSSNLNELENMFNDLKDYYYQKDNLLRISKTDTIFEIIYEGKETGEYSDNLN